MNRCAPAVSPGAAFALALAALALVVPATSAHPLGNFTINHYNGLRVATDAVLVDHVTDFAEIPTFSERRQMDTDADGDVSDSEAAAFDAARVRGVGDPDLDLTVGGSPLPLDDRQRGISFPMGQGNPTMRLVCVYSAALDRRALAAAAAFSFEDRFLRRATGLARDRRARATERRLQDSDAPDDGAHPTGSPTIPPTCCPFRLANRRRRFVANAGRPDTARPSPFPTRRRLASTADHRWRYQPMSRWRRQRRPPPRPSSPAGVTELGSDVTALFQAADLTPPIIALSLLVAVGLGRASRRFSRPRQDRHGRLPGRLARQRPPGGWPGSDGDGVAHDRRTCPGRSQPLRGRGHPGRASLYPILSVVSGAIVVVIGTLPAGHARCGVDVLSRRAARSHAAAHEHGVEHEHEHDHSRSACQPRLARARRDGPHPPVPSRASASAASSRSVCRAA